jgi:hypothetical protein
MVYSSPLGEKGCSMNSAATGRRPALSAVTRAGLIVLALLAPVTLAACTTTEGTNALTDIGTFEREVAIETMKGMGMMEREEKPDPSVRAPLVLPKSASLPAPQEETKVAMLPADSDKVEIDTSNLSDEDLRRLRNARVVDLRTIAGRPLTDAESKQLTARMKAGRISVTGGERPIYLPPEEYFTTVGGKDLVCLAKDGQLVPVNDPACPPEVRKALADSQ